MTPDAGARPPRRVTPFDPPGSVAALGFPLAEPAITALVRAALDEDASDRDVTTIATVRAEQRARARLVARQAGVVCGVPLALATFRALDPEVAIRVDADDGATVTPGQDVLFISGHARAMLGAERTALNFLQRLSGVASLTQAYVRAVAGTRASIVDTRKTTPGWRALEKYAVRCGGGRNHRMDLADAVLIKDNHLEAVGGDIAEAVRRVRAHAAPGTAVQVECDTLEQVATAVAAGAESVLLDNMTTDQLRAAVAAVAGRCVTEASGGVTLGSVRAIAETGVDRISVGALTHSAPALNLALDFE